MKKYLFILPLFLVTLLSCSEHNHQCTAETGEHSSAHHEEHATATGTIELDGNNKWKIVDNMMIHIDKMDQDVTNFKGSSYDEYQDLAALLLDNIHSLTSNCTMTGKAHDELHKWLLPFIDTVDKFAYSKNKEDAAKQFEEVKKSMSVFHQYFE